MALEPCGLLVLEIKAGDAGEDVEAFGKTRGFQGVADKQIGPANRVLTKVEAKAQQTVHKDVFIGDESLLLLENLREITAATLAQDPAIAQVVLDPGRRNDAKESVIANIKCQSASDGAGKVGALTTHPLQRYEIGREELARDPFANRQGNRTNALSAVEEGLKV